VVGTGGAEKTSIGVESHAGHEVGVIGQAMSKLPFRPIENLNLTEDSRRATPHGEILAR
jgi:hypothetical protein